MQQALECTSTRSIKKRFLFKLAFLSIPRLGFLSLVLLTFGIYMIFPCVGTFLQVHRETSVPYDLSVSADPRDMERLSEIEGVTKITPVCRIPAQLKTDTASQSIEVLGVFSSFLPPDFLEGGPFQDGTHTPFLVMNEAAAKGMETGNPISLDTRLTLNDQDAMIAGIFRDDREEPVCYMSYDTAIRGLEQEDQQEFILTLDRKGDIQKLGKTLTQWNLQTELDENLLLRWKLLGSQGLQLLTTACLSLLCGFGWIRRNSRKGEETSLMSLGCTEGEIKRLGWLRVLDAVTLCAAAAAGLFLIIRAV